ncbi:hypothetical protein F8M41_019790 [Gigaspora margarita]|uniref:SAM domain-containing protein n=1 Tax=Gigaspora margarita TaxID=4874 RepID=A0A8H4AJJ0_GIGMA|nr:hypothetical protein F8M41_019790 [Gigaspora margarita]
MSLKIVKKVASDQPTLCCPTSHSVYIGGIDNALTNMSGKVLRDLVFPIVDYKNIHVLKKQNLNYGHLHFESKQDAENFYITAKGQIFRIKDENVGTIEVYFKSPTHYNNNSNRNDNGEGTSYSTIVSNFAKVKPNFTTVKTNFLRMERNDTKAKSNQDKQQSYESISSASNVAKLRKSNTENLIEFLLNDEEFTNMDIGENVLSKLHEEKINENSFIRLSKADLKECGLKIGPSLEMEEYISRLELNNGGLRKRKFEDINN